MKFTSPVNAIVASLLGASATAMARSTVYMVSGNANSNAVQDNTPTISLDAFSMVLSHLTDTAVHHPALHWQNVKQDTLDAVRAVWEEWSSNVFERKLSKNAFIIVSGVQEPTDILPQYDPAYYVSDNHPEDFVALAKQTAQLVESDGQREAHMRELPATPEHECDMPLAALDTKNKIDQKFLAEVQHLKNVMEDGKGFLGVHLTGLQALGEHYGFSSAQYGEAKMILADFFRKEIPESAVEDARSLVTIVFTPQTPRQSSFGKRAIAEPTCHTSEHACENATSSCSGRGSCMRARDSECFTCQCQSSAFLGEACQVQDAVGDFQLLFWTGVGLTVLTSGVLLFVYKSGNVGNGGILAAPQPLPKRD